MIIIKYRYIMKKVIQILVLLIVVLVPFILTAQPHPADQLIGGGTGGAPTGGGAPIGGGLHGTRKIYDARKKVLD
jgi:hypothetical protein